MRVLVVSPRFPWPPHSGDRLRATIWIEALAERADVTLVSPPGDVPAGSSVRFAPAARSVIALCRGIARAITEGLPLQTVLTAGYEWRTALAGEPPFDAAVVLLSRTDPWVRSHIHSDIRVLDAIDALSRSAEERARAASPFGRMFWRREASRLGAAERTITAVYDRVVVIGYDESAAFPAPVTVIGNGVRLHPLDAAAPRAFDVGFWGRLAYFANAHAVRWLLDDIWPRIQQAMPSATLAIGGAAAPRAIRKLAEKAGIRIVTPIDRVSAWARSIRVALLPLQYGTGQSSKVLEAAEGGCAIVATPQALRGFSELARHARAASTPADLAAEVVALLKNEEIRRTAAAALRHTVENHYSRQKTLDGFRSVLSVEE